MDGISFHDAIEPDQLAELERLYADAWWAPGRDRAGIERMLAGSDEVVAAVGREGRLIGFARALTDGVYRAMVYDVIVAPELRGSGLGDRVLAELLARPAIAAAERVQLVCAEEMAGYYERFGFERLAAGLLVMSRTATPPRTRVRPD